MSNFRVEQTYEQLGALIHDEVVDQLCDDGDITTSHLPVPEETMAWATAIAESVRQGVLSQLDAAE